MTTKKRIKSLSLEGSDPSYFLNYAGTKKSYNKIWKDFSLYDLLLEQLKAPQAPKLRKVAILGSATGKILPVLEKKLGAKIYGCEINTWAHSQTPKKYLRYVKNENMLDFVDRSFEKGLLFDLTFSNSLIYLDEKELGRLLKKLPYITKYLHFASSLRGKACPDPYRKLLKSYQWWNQKLSKAGFEELKAKKGKTFIWISRKVSE